jgi:hypothetical protein
VVGGPVGGFGWWLGGGWVAVVTDCSETNRKLLQPAATTLRAHTPFNPSPQPHSKHDARLHTTHSTPPPPPSHQATW